MFVRIDSRNSFSHPGGVVGAVLPRDKDSTYTKPCLLIPSRLDKADRYRNRITRYAHGKPWHIMAFPRAMPARRKSVRTVNHTVPTASEGSSLFKPGSLPVTRHAYSTPSPSISTFLHSFSTYRRGEWFKPCGRPTRPTLGKSQGS